MGGSMFHLKKIELENRLILILLKISCSLRVSDGFPKQNVWIVGWVDGVNSIQFFIYVIF